MAEENNQIGTSVKIEAIGLILGILVLLANIIILMNWENLESSREFFRGGQPGGIIIGVSAIAGFCSSLLFFLNLLIGKRKFWGFRLIAVFTFLGLGAFLGSMV